MKALGILLLLTLLENSLGFPKPDKKKDNWKEIAKDALCDSRDSAGVMEALKDYDDTSLWFVLVSSGKKGDTLKRPKRDSDKGKGWAGDYKKGKLFDAEKCDLTMVVWRGKDLKIGDPGKCDTKKTSGVMQEVISRGKGKKEHNDDVRKRLKKKSKKEGIKHSFFILWSSGDWKWTSYGMSIEENKCLVQTPNGFFLINPGGEEDSSSSSEEDSDEDSSSSSEEDSEENSSSSSEEDSDEDSSSSSEEDSDEDLSSSSEEDSDEDSSSNKEEDSYEDLSSSSKEDSDEDSSPSKEDSDEDSSPSKENSDEDSSSSSKEDSELVEESEEVLGLRSSNGYDE